MGVVDGESPHPRQSVELAGLLEAVAGAELCVADRQVPVATGLVGVDLDVVRAVHGLEEVLIAFALAVPRGDRGILGVGVVGVVAALLVEVDVSDVRRDHRLVPARL